MASLRSIHTHVCVNRTMMHLITKKLQLMSIEVDRRGAPLVRDVMTPLRNIHTCVCEQENESIDDEEASAHEHESGQTWSSISKGSNDIPTWYSYMHASYVVMVCR